MAQTETQAAAPTGLESEPDFIELPDNSSTRPSTSDRNTVRKPEQPPRKRPRRSAKSVAIVTADDPPDEITWQEWIARRFTGDEGAGLGISLILHLMLIAMAAIVIIGHVRNGPLITTVLTDAGDDDFILGDKLDTELSSPEPKGDEEQFQLPDLIADDSQPITDALFAESVSSKGEGIGAGAVADGMRFVPENAVTAGSFTAWTIPTFGHPDRGSYYARRFGEPDPKPGDSPHPGQPYYIMIQIKVPEGRRRFPLRDLTGSIIGTDHYQQRIPEHTFVLDRDGKPTHITGNSLPVVDGVVQILVWVPGAQELVKDTIDISSKMLDEEQTLDLVFKNPDD